MGKFIFAKTVVFAVCVGSMTIGMAGQFKVQNFTPFSAVVNGSANVNAYGDGTPAFSTNLRCAYRHDGSILYTGGNGSISVRNVPQPKSIQQFVQLCRANANLGDIAEAVGYIDEGVSSVSFSVNNVSSVTSASGSATGVVNYEGANANLTCIYNSNVMQPNTQPELTYGSPSQVIYVGIPLNGYINSAREFQEKCSAHLASALETAASSSQMDPEFPDGE